jgi:ABC-type transport system involved in multi-copper enzyme maturation permease subunit
MEFPILAKEIRVALRRRETFFSAFSFYSLIALVVLLFWALVMVEEAFQGREFFSRMLFFLVIFFGYLLFCIHSCLSAARILITEREKNTSALIRVAPIRPASLVMQKMMTPVFVEWLVFFGLLPIFSLVFLMGGVSPGEFVYQLVNLAIWMNTSILIGLALSSRARSVTRAVARSIAALFLLAFLIPGLPFLMTAAAESVRYFAKGHNGAFSVISNSLIEGFQFLSWAFAPLEALSPFWMFISGYPDSLMLQSGYSSDYFMNLIPKCPAALSWGIHAALQILLFLAAVRGWKTSTEEAEIPYDRNERNGVAGHLRWLLRGRAKRSFFPCGWWAFYEQEDREVFKKGVTSKILVSLGIVIGPFLFLQFYASLDEKSVAEAVMSIIPLAGLAALVACFGMGSNALRREKTRGTSMMLIVSPHPLKAIVFGKWLYYQIFAVKLIFLGVIVAAVHNGLCWMDGRRWTLEHPWTFLVPLPYVAVFIPIVSLLGVYGGLRPRRYTPLWRVVVMVFTVWIVASLGVGVLQGKHVEEVARFLQVVIYDVLPMMIVALTALTLMERWGIAPGEIAEKRSLRMALGCVLLSLLILDLAGSHLEPPSGSYRSISDNPIGEWRAVSHILGIPICLAWLFWLWLSTRSKTWWLKRLLKEELSTPG